MKELSTPPSRPPTDTETEAAYAWLLRAVGGKFGSLMIALVALLVSSPLMAVGWVWNLLHRLFGSAVLVAGLQAARLGRRSLRIGLVLAAADLAIGRLVFFEGARWLVVVEAFLWLATLIYVTLTILDTMFTRRRVDVETLQAALCVYMLLGLIWLNVYSLIALGAPGAFRYQGVPQTAWTDDLSRRAETLRLLIFSYSTLTSSGIGDLTTASNFASICAILEGLTGQVYLAVVIARLVGLQAAPPTRDNGAS